MLRTLKLIALASFSVFAIPGCAEENQKIVVGASSTPHALILEQAKEYIHDRGFELEIRVFDDYVLPNYALENGELHANYFQHKPYLNEFNSSNGTHLIPVLDVHFEPMGIYSGKKDSISDFENSDTILVPSDKSNYDRAMALLSIYGMDNGSNIVKIEAQSIPLMLEDCSFAVINGNYALASGVVGRCIETEDKDSEIAKTMANVIAVKEGNENTEKTSLLKEALSQENIKNFIEDKFGNSVIYMI